MEDSPVLNERARDLSRRIGEFLDDFGRWLDPDVCERMVQAKKRLDDLDNRPADEDAGS